MLGFRGVDAPASSTIAADLRDRSIGAVVLFDYDVPSARQGRNITSPAQLHDLCAQLRDAAGERRLLIAVDQEGGRVARLGPKNGYPATPAAADVTTAEQARQTGADIGAMLAAAGIDLDLAPVVDLNVNASNPIIGALGRSYSADPDAVATMAVALLDGLRTQGVHGVLKHFPGHGSSTGDTHEGVVDVTDTWTRNELRPYELLAATDLVGAVMVAHVFNRVLDPVHPASLSKATIDGLLRGQLGFTGAVISDDLQMGAITSQYGFSDTIRLALEAGNDLLCLSNNVTYDPELGARAHGTVLDLVASGAVPADRVLEANARVQALKSLLG